MAYATVASLKLKINKQLNVDDQVLQGALDHASTLIDQVCHRDPGGFQAIPQPSARLYSGNGTGVQRINECVEVTLVEVKDSPSDNTYTAWESTDWIAATGDPRFPDFNTTPYLFLLALPTGTYDIFTSGRWVHRMGFRPIHPIRTKFGTPTVRVTARWGYADSVPGEIAEAVVIQASRWFKRGQSSYSDTMSTSDFGQLFYQRTLDPDIALILDKGRYISPLFKP